MTAALLYPYGTY